MKITLLKIGLILLVIIVIFCIIALFTTKRYTLTRKITINQSVDKVYNFVRFHSNQQQYNTWLRNDPNTVITIDHNQDGQTGAILHFESSNKKAGTGNWINEKFIENKQIDYSIQFLKPYTFKANGAIYFQDLGQNQMSLTWVYHSGMDWPMNIILLFIDMDKTIGKDIEITLENLKKITEKL